MKNSIALGVAVAMTFCQVAQAADALSPHETLMKAKATAEKVMATVPKLHLQSEESLDQTRGFVRAVREIAVQVVAHESEFDADDVKAAKDLEARAAKWATDEDALIKAEESGRADVVLPLCDALWTIDTYRDSIAKEKANPSGVVNLRTLHSDGDMLQRYQDIAKELAPKYAAFRHHAFTKWESEGVCVAESKKDG